MQFQPAMIEAIKAGRKTQTRRPMKPGDYQLEPYACGRLHPNLSPVFDENNRHRMRWQPGHRYSICPGRGKARVGLIQITGIRLERLGDISENDARAEGFESRDAFLAAWKALYPKGNLDADVWVLEFQLA